MTCPGVGQSPASVVSWHVETDKRGVVLSRLNELAAEQFGIREMREFGVCPACRAEFEFPGGVIRFHHEPFRITRW